ncbi:MAG: PAS domain-containing protein [Xanthobacteraceae bacterium]|nr:PAS domain-containing protein [Xanthobacteraceae bacterium]
MKHPSNRDFFARWNEARGKALAPDRNAMPPESVRHLLSDIFVLSYDPARGYPFRVAGTRVCARLGRDLKSENFCALFEDEARSEIEDLIGVVAEESIPTVIGLTAAAQWGEIVHAELLLLPFSARVHTPMSLTGMLAFFHDGPGTIGRFGVTSWRHLHQDARFFGPRTLRKLEVVRGFMVYEGLR